jgi:tRNA modification GTPase
MDGYLRHSFERWREVLLQCLAHTEAVIDFGDDDREDDVDASQVMAAIVPKVQQLRTELQSHLADSRRGVSPPLRTERDSCSCGAAVSQAR